MRLTEVLETIGSLYRANARTVIALTAVVAIPAFLLSVMVARALAPVAERIAALDPFGGAAAAPSAALLADVGAVVALSLAAIAIDQVAIALIAAALAIALGRPGEPALTPGGALRRLPSVALRLVPAVAIILAALVGLVLAWIVLQVPLTLALGATLVGGGPGAFFVLLGVVAVAAAAVFLLVRWSLAAPVAALETPNPVATLGRSWSLVGGSTWRVLGYALLVGLVVVILDLTLVQSVAAIVSAVVPSAVTAVEVGLGAVAQVLLAPIGALLSLVLYHDLRLRATGTRRAL
jgi:hypothetical protein